jgi:hypothetical protein
MKRSSWTFAAALVGAGLCAGTAHAQANLPGITNGIPTGPVVGQAPERGRKQPPPPALPGARTTNADPAPADRPASEMRPTEALFDSVNRGDIAGARDALSRGAELNAQNVLGMTPLELSVDLGRNDITFLLLSMRGSGSQSAGREAPSKTGTPPKAQAARQPPSHTAPVRQVAAPAPKPAQTTTRQQYADVPGVPAPRAGFLGFGGAATR